MTAGVVKRTERKVERLGSFAAAVKESLVKMDDGDYVAKLWTRDASIWKSDEASQAQIKNSLGWLNIAVMQRKKCDDLEKFANEIRSAGFTDVVLLGMGGSSLCPEVLRRVFGPKAGYPKFHMLDSTVPASVRSLEKKLDLAKSLFIVASKSGSTIEPQMFYRYFFGRVRELKGDAAGDNFIAITDPGTLAEKQAKEAKFRRIFLGQADIGGRYSALTNFGMVPAALMGLDIRVMLDRALHSVNFCSQNTPTLGMPGARRAAAIGTFAKAGRDKMTLVLDPLLESLGLWIEQLIGESTGKEGVGIVPIAGEPVGPPEVYGNDRFFVYIHYRETDDAVLEAKLDALTEAGHPFLRIILNELVNLGEEFFLWEFATALIGALMEINPFDQPNVQESKTNTVALIETYKSTGKLPEPDVILHDGTFTVYGDTSAFGGAKSIGDVLRAHVARIRPGDYFAITQYIEETPEHDAILQKMRTAIRDRRKVATTTGYAPRFLHSTGQLHKGGGDNGIFLQIVSDDAEDLAIAGEAFSFGVLKTAQSIGDFQSLQSRNRRALRIHIGGDLEAGLARLSEELIKVL